MRVSTLFIFLTMSFFANGQNDSLKIKVEKLASSLDATVSVSILHIETNEAVRYNGDLLQPMMSIYKFPIALAVLNKVDKGEITMDKKVQFNRSIIHPGDEEVFSTDNFQENKISIKDLVTLMLVYGSNTACDILLDQVIAPNKVQLYIHSLGIKSITIANTEKELQADNAIQLRNSSTANSLVQLLTTTLKKNILSTASSNFLWEKMTESVTAPDRIKGMLPAGTKVAHRTGTSTNTYNDSGIITLPDGSHLVISAFISRAKEYPATCNATIAKIALLAWNDYSTRN